MPLGVTKHVLRVTWVTEREGGKERGANFDSSIVSSLLPLNNFFAVETRDPLYPREEFKHYTAVPIVQLSSKWNWNMVHFTP